MSYLQEILSVLDWESLVILIVPIIISFIKGKLDEYNINIPQLAMIIGILSEGLISLAAGNTINPILGAALGAIGVGLREYLDQTKKVHNRKKS